MPKKFWVQKRWELSGLVGSVALLALTVSGIGWSWSQTEIVPEIATIPMTVAENPPLVEIGSEESGEVQRLHFKREDGTPLRTQIVYRNKTIGEVMYRPDGTVSTFTIADTSGALLRESTYDEAGENVVNGYEKRPNQTMMWETATLPDGTVQTTTYWDDGKHVFSKRVTTPTIGTTPGIIETTYWRGGGSLWLHTLARLDSPDMPYEEELFNHISGKMERSIKRGEHGGADVSFYRRDGSLYFVRHYVVHASPQSSYIKQDATTVYAEDGVTPAMKIMWWWDLNPMTVEVFKGNGTREIHFFGTGRQTGDLTVFDAAGKVTSQSKLGADPTLFQKLDWYMWAKEAPPPEDPEAHRAELART